MTDLNQVSALASIQMVQALPEKSGFTSIMTDRESVKSFRWVKITRSRYLSSKPQWLENAPVGPNLRHAKPQRGYQTTSTPSATCMCVGVVRK